MIIAAWGQPRQQLPRLCHRYSNQQLVRETVRAECSSPNSTKTTVEQTLLQEVAQKPIKLIKATITADYSSSWSAQRTAAQALKQVVVTQQMIGGIR